MVWALGIGILACDRWGTKSFGLSLLLGLMVLLLFVLFSIHRLLRSYQNRWVFGVVALVAVAWLGFVRMSMFQKRFDDQKATQQEKGWQVARLLEPPEEREKTVKVLVELQSGKAIAYFQKDDNALDLKYGDLVGFGAALEEVAPPKNPMEFNYKKYLGRRGVNWSVYLKSGEWMPTGIRQANPVYDFAYRFRHRLLKALQHCGVTDEEFGVGAAILLGYDESLPVQVRNNYVAAGSMHILCVSGMHVGVIYLLASFLLGLLGQGKRMAFIRRMVLLFLIWFYALLTGLSPSIMRSALMISFMIFGELLHRKGFALNSIAASAFVLLLLDPNHLFAMGFQLSYAAVVGIVLLQRPIYNMVFVKNRWLDKVWEITAVSISAQIATMPFTLYYFHQFTPYFWLSNLLMTPLSFVVIVLGMLLLALAWVPWLNLVLGKLVWLSLHLMNALVADIEHLPMSLVKGLYLSDFQFFLSLLLLLLLWLFVNLKRKRMLLELLVIALVFSFSQAWRCQMLARQSQVVVYSLRNHTAISVVEGFDQVLICDDGLLEEPSVIDYSLKGYWSERQLSMNPPCFTLSEDIKKGWVLKQKNLISTHGLMLALWEPLLAGGDGIHRVPVDCLLVRGRQRPDLKLAAQTYQIGMLLIDGSVPEYLAAEWIRQAEAMRIPCRNLKERAFVI